MKYLEKTDLGRTETSPPRFSITLWAGMNLVMSQIHPQNSQLVSSQHREEVQESF